MAPNSRHPPSAAPPPASQHPAYSAMPAGYQNLQSFYPNTATQADLQHILRLVSELCDINSNNRKETERMMQGVEKMVAAHSRPSSAEATADGQPSRSVDISEYVLLQNKLADMTRRSEQQSQIIVRYADILNDYEDTMGSMMVRVREFAHAHTSTLLQWHKYYNELLQKERDEKHELFSEVAQKEQNLSDARAKFSEIKSNILECELPYKKDNAYLKAENKFLKRRLGAPYNNDSDDEAENLRPTSSSAAAAATTHQPNEIQHYTTEDDQVPKQDLEAIKEWRNLFTKLKVAKSTRFHRDLNEDRVFAIKKLERLQREKQARDEEDRLQRVAHYQLRPNTPPSATIRLVRNATDPMDNVLRITNPDSTSENVGGCIKGETVSADENGIERLQLPPSLSLFWAPPPEPEEPPRDCN